jgi:hypothetical protein
MIGFYILPAAAALIIISPNRYAAAVFLATVMFVPTGANIAIAGINLYPLRILILASLVQLALHRKLHPPSLSAPDKTMIIFAVLCLWSSLFHMDVQRAFVYRTGMCVDFLGSYFIFRCWIREWGDLSYLFGIWFICIFALAVFMIVEQITGRDVFAMVGGLPLLDDIREGRLRARGPFRHPILAGTAGAIFLPFALALYRRKAVLGVVGVIVGITVVICSSSSGPVGSLVAALIGVGLWQFREKLGLILKVSLGLLLFLHFFIMKAPVWYLIARASSVGGSTGYHRARLIDKAIIYINEWWFAGTDYTRHWMPTGIGWSEDHTDITNWYLAMGVQGGLPLMLAFIAIIWVCFKLLGKTMGLLSSENEKNQFLIWCMGSALFSHAVSMLSVGYYDQSGGLFFVLLGTIVSSCMLFIREESLLSKLGEISDLDV